MRLRDRLRSAGFVVWVDEDEMCESIADDIINGLDRATVVLVCMTQKYYESPYCKKEVIYAAESHKEIIPLTLEHRYKPHGWLKFHMSDRLRYDFSRDDVFEESLRKLVRAIRNVKNSSPVGCRMVDHVDGEVVETSVVSTHQPVAETPGGHYMYLSASMPLVENAVCSWKSAEIANWLERNGLQHLHDCFKDFTGELLLEYKLLQRELPETFAACIRQELEQGRLTTLDVLRLTRALKLL
jgi:male-specific lethal 1